MSSMSDPEPTEPSVFAMAPATICSEGEPRRALGFQWGVGDEAQRVVAILGDDPREAGPAQIARWAREIARACDRLMEPTALPRPSISLDRAFDVAEARSKLATHPFVDMCRIGKPGNMMAVINEMKARVAILQDRGVSVYAVKQEFDYGAETWYKLMTDVRAEDAEGEPKEAAACSAGSAHGAPQGAPIP